MDHLRKSKTITFRLLSLVIVIVVVQNFLLVRENEQYMKDIKGLKEETAYNIHIHENDTLGVLRALTIDSSAILIDPAIRQSNILYFFFATTCQACKNNMPNWNNLMDTLSHQRVRIVGLSPDSLFRIRELLAHVPAKFPVFSVVPDLPKLKKYKLTIFPSTILVEPSGVVKRLWGGLLSDEKMKEILYATM